MWQFIKGAKTFVGNVPCHIKHMNLSNVSLKSELQFNRDAQCELLNAVNRRIMGQEVVATANGVELSLL